MANVHHPQNTPSKKFEATDDDLPSILLDRVSHARERIARTAGEMGIDLDAEAMNAFAVLLVGLEENETAASRHGRH